MSFDRFDIVEAHYCFYSDYHDGMFSEFYKRLCKINRYHRPSPLGSDYWRLSENGREIYDNLRQKHNV